MKRFAFAATLISTLTLPAAAFAYVGPGAGISLLGALWALLLAVGTAVLFVVAWPVRKMVRRRRQAGMRSREAPREHRDS
ncbi:hypothetical protein KXS07_19995 [Inquilinus limosus]|uniref:hypothetical protein n=1 Tax=Inquilinus limosus TaxID=171674 RepID=UPI003F153C7A